ncbi:MAG: endo alpha-1,4 polygalactosaminidase [bacterium]|nr:endo alpha-1,4 polygalactosaminidase [bacterium]
MIENWTIQLQGLDPVSSKAALARRTVDMVVIDPMRSQRGEATFPMQDLVRAVQRSPGKSLPHKRVIAYLNLGQAEDYRSYWRAEWRAPTAGRSGQPDFLLAPDPEGWAGNFPVAFWRPEWRCCLYGHADAPLDQILADGFDGIYCDWVLGYLDADVQAAAVRDGVDAAREMIRLLADLRAYARERYPLFVLVAQNAISLAEQHPDLFAAVDGLAQEDLSFRGLASATWDDPSAGDIPAPPTGAWSTARLGQRLADVRTRGVPVFTLDYSLRADNANRARATARSFGLVPCVSRTPLDRLPAAPSR